MEASAELEAIRRHYAHADLAGAITAALVAAGKGAGRLTTEDLAPLDEFHIRGRQATLELARAAGIGPEQRVLDVGSGIGGPSRCLAAVFGCRVSGVDLSADYCRVATMLAERCGLTARVDYRQGDALALDFPDESFDLVWSQHVAMNIADKGALYREMGRVLKRGGKLALYDVLAGPGGEPLLPVPWARQAEASFLATPEELRRLLEENGFTLLDWEDTTESAEQWFARFAGRLHQQPSLPPLGVHLLLGPDFPLMARNQLRNLQERRILLAQVVAQK